MPMTLTAAANDEFELTSLATDQSESAATILTLP